MKECSICKIEKDTSCFHAAKNTSDKLYSSCKECKKSRSKPEWRKSYYEKNKDQLLEWHRKHRLANLDKIKIRTKEYYAKNKEKVDKRNKSNRIKNELEYKLTAKKRYDNNIDKERLRSKKYRENNYEKDLIAKRVYTQSDRGRNKELLRRYNITLDFYNDLKKEQDNKCAICFRDESTMTKRMAIDHCHKTGKVRNLLCDVCNRTLGLLKENIDLLAKMVHYIMKHKNGGTNGTEKC